VCLQEDTREGVCLKVDTREGVCLQEDTREGVCLKVDTREWVCLQVDTREGVCLKVGRREGVCLGGCTWSSVLPQAYSRLLRWNCRTFSSSSLNWIPDSCRKCLYTSWTFSVRVKYLVQCSSWQYISHDLTNESIKRFTHCINLVLKSRPVYNALKMLCLR